MSERDDDLDYAALYKNRDSSTTTKAPPVSSTPASPSLPPASTDDDTKLNEGDESDTDYNKLYVGREAENNGFFHTGANFITNLADVVINHKKYGEYLRAADAQQGTVAHLMWEGLTKQITFDDVTSGIAKAGTMAKATLKTAASGFIEHPIAGTAKGISTVATGLEQMLTKPFEAAIGVKLTENDIRLLPPEERADLALNTAGDVAMTLVTGAVGKAVKAAMIGGDIAKASAAVSTAADISTVPTNTLRTLEMGSRAGRITRTVLGNTAGRIADSQAAQHVAANLTAGIAGGMTQGAIANARSEDVVAHSLLTGVMTAPLGFATELLGNTLGRGVQDAKQIATKVLQERELKLYVDSNIERTVATIQGLESADNFAQALANRAIITRPNEMHIIEGVENTPNVVHPELKVYKGPGNTVAIVGMDVSPVDVNFFQRTGHKLNGEVSVDGKSHIVEGFGPNNTLKLRRFGSNETVFANPNEIRRVPNAVDTSKPGTIVLEKQYDEFVRHVYGDTELSKEPTEGAFEDAFRDYATRLGYKENQLPGVREYFLNRMNKELESQMDPLERQVMQNVEYELGNEQNLIRNDIEERGTKLTQAARSNRMYIDVEEGGLYAIKSTETGKTLIRVFGEENALDFINKSGQAKTIKYDGDGHAPYEIIRGTMPPAPEVNFTSAPTGKKIRFWNRDWMGVKLDQLNIMAPWMTVASDQLKSLDNVYKTRFAPRVWDATQVARRKYLGEMRPFQVRVKAIESLLKGMNREDRLAVTDNVETMSAAEVIEKGLKSRRMNEEEINAGKYFFDNDINIDRVYGYRKEVLELSRQTKDRATRNERLKEIREENGMDEKHLAAYKMVKNLDEKHGELSSYIAARYSRALNGGLTRADHAAKFFNPKYSNRQKMAVQMIDKLHDDLAANVGLDDSRLLNGYMSHIRNYKNEYDPPRPQFKRETFLAESVRNGAVDLDPMNREPISILVNYVNGLMKTKHFSPEYNKAIVALREELNLVEGVDTAKSIENRVMNYLETLDGRRDESRRIAHAHLEKISQILGYNKSKTEIAEVADKWMNRYAATVELSAQGFRPFQGLRDLNGYINNYFARFGVNRTNRMIKFLADREGIQRVRASGEAGELSPMEFAANTTDNRGLQVALSTGEKILNAGFDASLQKLSYDNIHAAIYLETIDTINKGLTKVSKGEWSYEKFEKKVDLSVHDPSTIQYFRSLYNAGKYREAAEFVARQNTAENAFIYGAANHAAGWGSYVGKLAGQFGTWSLWQSRFIGRLASRGTVGERAARVGRWALTQAALFATDRAVGVNLSGWMQTPATLGFFGGPVIGAAQNAANAFNDQEFIRKNARRQLKRNATLLVPGASFIRDQSRAMDAWGHGDEFHAVLQHLGLRYRADYSDHSRKPKNEELEEYVPMQ